MSYITLTLPFNVLGDDARILIATAKQFRLVTLKVFDEFLRDEKPPLSQFSMYKGYRKVGYEILPNRRYVDGAIDLVYGAIESVNELNRLYKEMGFNGEIKLEDIEWKNWLLFQCEGESQHMNVNIKIQEDLSFRVLAFDFDGDKSYIFIRPTIPKRYELILRNLWFYMQPYYARVVLKQFGNRKGVIFTHGEVQVSIDYDFYLDFMRRFDEPKGKNVAGVDVNLDRINLAIVSRDGKLRDYKTYWFREVKSRNMPRRRVLSLIGERVHELLKYAYHHGVSRIYFEDLSVLGKLKLIWIKNGKRFNENYNYAVQTFRSRVIEMIRLKAPIYGLKTSYVNPANTSKIGEIKAKKLGVDRHTASAYIIALRGLKLFNVV
jgi:IS605 OrfB family transposase